jgi:hypothetical protein
VEYVRQSRIVFPKALYKARARIEQAVGKLKRFKRIALRCEKTAQNYGSFAYPTWCRPKIPVAIFRGIPENSIDFGIFLRRFVHLDLEIIQAYLRALWPIVKNEANIVLQYSDKTKAAVQRNRTFSENTPDTMGLCIGSWVHHPRRERDYFAAQFNHAFSKRCGARGVLIRCGNEVRDLSGDNACRPVGSAWRWSGEQLFKPVGDFRLVVEIAGTPMPSCLDELEENAICRAACRR